MKKIIIDTNWWISFIVSKKSTGLPAFFFNDIFFCFSAELALEISNVLQYKHIAGRINETNLQAFIFFQKNIARFFDVVNDVKVCRDSKVNFLLALAREAKADFLITSDEDLLTLKQFGNTSIVTLKDFFEIVYPA